VVQHLNEDNRERENRGVRSAGVLHVTLPHAKGATQTTERHEWINGAHMLKEHIQEHRATSVGGAVKHVNNCAAKLFADEAAVFYAQRREVEMIEDRWRKS